MATTVSYSDEHMNISITYKKNPALTVDEVMQELIAPMLFAAGYSIEVINRTLCSEKDCPVQSMYDDLDKGGEN